MHLSRFPRISLAHLPTPLEPLIRLSEFLGGPNIYVKRDDCTGLASGGNKTRKLEFLMADAIAQKADTIITQGAVQSNHARQTAAAAAKIGMQCELLFENRITHLNEHYMNSGNVFLDRLFGANIHHYDKGADMNAAMTERASALKSKGRKPYIIPGGGSNKIGALGYVNCALELLSQVNDQSLVLHHIVHATGSAGTQAGLITGLKSTHANIPVLGIGVSALQNQQEEKVFGLAEETAEYIGAAGSVKREDVVVNCDYVGDGYGIPTQGMKDAISLLATMEGLLFDPVYSGKALAGMIDLIKKNHFKKNDNIVFLHTGGSMGLFGYQDQL